MKRRCRRKGHVSIKHRGGWLCLDCLAAHIQEVIGTPGVIVHINSGKRGMK